MSDALNACADSDVVVAERRATTVRSGARRRSTSANGARDQLGYVYGANAGARFAVHVLQIENTVSWQFRYDNTDGEYSPLPAQQLMDALVSQTRSVIDLRE